jgi:NDP-sugar pyrophosphorylase family protein
MLLSSGVSSFGDAIRQVDAQSIIKSDFVLVSGDMVSNVRIDEIVRVHKERRKVNKDIIMTCLVKECGVGHRTRWVPCPQGKTGGDINKGVFVGRKERLLFGPLIKIPRSA